MLINGPMIITKGYRTKQERMYDWLVSSCDVKVNERCHTRRVQKGSRKVLAIAIVHMASDRWH